MPGYGNPQDFFTAYPFIPYQFNLLQKVFTQIRLMGSAGISSLLGWELAISAIS